MKKNILKVAFSILGLATVLNSCRDEFVDTAFYQSVQQSPLNTIEEMENFVRGGYASMRSASYYGCDYLMISEARSDNMYADWVNGSGYYNTVASYSMISTDAYASGPYTAIYSAIAKANIVINNTPSTPLSWKASQDAATIDRKSNYLKGQAYAQRALSLFDALRLFGQEYAGGTLGVVVPLEYNPTKLQARSTVAETRVQIESDFDKAILLMNPAVDNFNDKTILNTLSVKGLMSRYYLYKGDFAKVRQLVSDIVASTKYKVIAGQDYAKFFNTANSAQNSMFEIAVGSTTALGTTSVAYKLNSGGYGTMRVLPALNNTYASTDVRKALITAVGTTFRLNGKYNDLTGAENIKLVRYEEILLNGAEAELNGGDPAKALTYYNLILTNRGLTAATSVTLADVYLERKKELVGEGFGYWDLLRLGQPITQRSNTAAAVVTVRNIGDNLLAFPIPRAELNVPGTLVVANPGYAN